MLTDMPVNFRAWSDALKSICFTRFSGDVADIKNFCAAGQNCIRKPLYQQIWQQTGIQTAWTNQDQIASKMADVVGGYAGDSSGSIQTFRILPGYSVSCASPLTSTIS